MSERAIKMGLCAEQVPSSSLKRTSLNRPSAKHRSSKPSRVLLNWSSMCRSWSKLTNFCCPEVAVSLRIENKSGMSRNSAAWKQNLMSYFNTQYLRNSTFFYLLKMEYVPKIVFVTDFVILVNFMKKRKIYLHMGGFQLLDLILPELKSHVIPYKFKCSHWWKIHL